MLLKEHATLKISNCEDIRSIAGVQYQSFKDACFLMGFLKDDKEYIVAIREVGDLGSGH